MTHMLTRSPLGYQPEEKRPPHRAENRTNYGHLHKQKMPLATSEDADTRDMPSTGIGGVSSFPETPW